jgi:hypothetical protein
MGEKTVFFGPLLSSLRAKRGPAKKRTKTNLDNTAVLL